MTRFGIGLLSAATLLGSAAPASGSEGGIVPTRAPVPPFECKAYVAYDRDMELPGYWIATSAGDRTCVPFTSTLNQPPEGYRGDYYVDEFTDTKPIGRASCRERVCQYVYVSVVAGSLKKK